MPADATPVPHPTLDKWLHAIVIALACALAAYISVVSFRGEEFTHDAGYMAFQFWVCVAFMGIYFLEIRMSPRPWRFMWRHLPFLLISIPYVNIIGWLGLEVPATLKYYLHFVPLLRGLIAMVAVVMYVCSSRLMGLFWSYMCLIALSMYFASMLFYVKEGAVNPEVTDYGTAVWWCGLQLTTIGAPIRPLTADGKVLAAMLACMGMVLLPLFTVYITSLVKRAVKREPKNIQ